MSFLADFTLFLYFSKKYSTFGQTSKKTRQQDDEIVLEKKHTRFSLYPVLYYLFRMSCFFILTIFIIETLIFPLNLENISFIFAWMHKFKPEMSEETIRGESIFAHSKRWPGWVKRSTHYYRPTYQI